MTIKSKIDHLGRSLLNEEKFYQKHEDIRCDVKRGWIPHGLVHEDENRTKSAKGVIIVGLNPGQADAEERRFCRTHLNQYDEIIAYWKERFLFKHRYYKSLRSMVDSLGLRGPILWTEIVKCQGKKNGYLSIQTIRDDIHKHLYKEIEIAPKNWPIIAVGSRAYEILCYQYLDRKIMGVPHSTGSFGQFSRFYSSTAGINPQIKKDLLRNIKSPEPTAMMVRCKKNKCWLE